MPSRVDSISRGFTRRLRRLIRRLGLHARPRSVIGLVLLGFGLAILPLAAGIWFVTQEVEQLTARSGLTVDRAVRLTRSGHRLVEGLEVMERRARQHWVLDDDDSRRRFLEATQALDDEARLFIGEATDEQLDRVQRVRTESAALAQSIVRGGGSASWPAELTEEFAGLRQEARSALLAGELQVGREVEAMRQQSRQTRHGLYWQLIAGLAMAVVLALIFTELITRPIRRLNRGIRGLADPTHPIPPRIRFPRDLAALSARLRWVHTRLRRTERDRTRFLHHVSHELKTPLSALREGISLIREGLLGPLSAEQAEVSEILEENARQLQSRIEDLLRYNRLQSGRDAPRREPIHLQKLSTGLQEQFEPSLRARSLSVEQLLPDTLEVMADPDRLRTILENLLSNAVKYASTGGRIQISGRAESEQIVLEVADDGPGIPENERARLFEPFYRGSVPAGGQVPGTGLGLAISRELARGQGGDLEIVSRPPWTTVFRLSLPRPVHQGE